MSSAFRSHSVVTLLVVLSLLLAESAAASGHNFLASIGDYTSGSFSPERNETFGIPVFIPSSEQVKALQIEIRTGDDDLVRTLKAARVSSTVSEYLIEWNGRDSNGAIVPDEAYHPVLVVTDADDETHRLDSRTQSGGEEVYDFEKHIKPGTIEYILPAASRVLVRAGIKNGPLLRTVVDWEPRTKGFHAERWDGRDEDNLVHIERNPDVGYLIVGYQLPDKSIITYGNDRETYRQYRERHGLPLREIAFEKRLPERNGRVIRQEFYNPLLQQKSPGIEVVLLDEESRQPVDRIVGFGEVLTELRLNALDEIYLDQERYEISFFIDNRFIAEEEQGFVPFVWRWSPGRLGIEPGEHLLTVNVSGYRGQVGVRNLAFRVIEEDQGATAEGK
jgi:flagellar hook assembly protein FlgD